MTANAQPTSEQRPAAIFLRDNLVVLAQCGDQAFEIQLQPRQAVEFAAALIGTAVECSGGRLDSEIPLDPTRALEFGLALCNVALDVARNNSAVRSGATAAIREAMK